MLIISEQVHRSISVLRKEYPECIFSSVIKEYWYLAFVAKIHHSQNNCVLQQHNKQDALTNIGKGAFLQKQYIIIQRHQWFPKEGIRSIIFFAFNETVLPKVKERPYVCLAHSGSLHPTMLADLCLCGEIRTDTQSSFSQNSHLKRSRKHSFLTWLFSNSSQKITHVLEAHAGMCSAVAGPWILVNWKFILCMSSLLETQ